MIEMSKGYKLGDILLYYRRMGQIKKMKAPCKVRLVEINDNVIGSNHTIIEIENNQQWYAHEINIHTLDQHNKVHAKYYKDLMGSGNALPRKIRKQMKKFFNLHPEYLI